MKVAILGCGAVSELYYTPALQALKGQLEVGALLDPNSDRLAQLQKAFPAARPAYRVGELREQGIELVIVASPVRFHAEQAIQALESGISVLCEKPMAATTAEGEAMLRTARETDQILAVGLFRRFFPAARLIHQMLSDNLLGSVKSFHFTEGGVFSWPAQSASFFQKTSAQGGVLLDLGVHLLDLLLWWFGQPTQVFYEDDATGGLEANCRLLLAFPQGFKGEVRLSRDWSLSNRYLIECEKGWLSWQVGEADKVQMGLYGSDFALDARLHHQVSKGALPELGLPADGYHRSFIRQLQNVAAAVRGTGEVLVSGEQGIASLRLIEQCYERRSLMPMPWLSGHEQAQATRLATGTL
ncbi:MAG: Gfo/Idh/MocA family oxidoreductase [Gemmatimonadaceae bacterium]|nr:Gfo/Idh/MocA family oxidoreductase [Gloeobacterales cyanobacterium ES-bin-141]